MAKLSLMKSEWEGNKWPSVEINQYENDDFLKVLYEICHLFSVSIPPIVDILDGYAAEINFNGSNVKIMMDNWTFSVAAENSSLRDKIFEALEALNV